MPKLAENPVGPRVVNGSSTGKPLPYQLQIRLDDRNTGCSAVLISPRFALSAHHCTHDIGIGITDSTLAAGVYTRLDKAKIGQVRQIKDIKQLHHTNGQAQKTNDPDIVVIEVNEPFEMNEFVRPACLPARQVLPSETCIVSGWGRILNEAKVDKGSDLDLQAAKVDMVHNDDGSYCKKFWNHPKFDGYPSVYVGDHTLCVFDQDSSGCPGDSGGPLVCGTSGGATIHGIVSFGDHDCHNRDEAPYQTYPWIVVNVFHFIDQIESIIVRQNPKTFLHSVTFILEYM